MAEQPKIIKTEDGSCTLYLENMDETYHSTHGALAESLHVYIRNGLDRLKENTHINILEIGFGTGLNALLTLDHLLPGQHINYYSIEPYPLQSETIKAYYGQFTRPPHNLARMDKLMGGDSGTLNPVTEHFDFCLLHKTLQSLEPSDVHHSTFDLVYYDAFGPSKQPEMWTPETLAKATELMSPGGVLCTYCAQGQFKRNLKSLGLTVENPEGALGKRQMTVGRKMDN